MAHSTNAGANTEYREQDQASMTDQEGGPRHEFGPVLLSVTCVASCVCTGPCDNSQERSGISDDESSTGFNAWLLNGRETAIRNMRASVLRLGHDRDMNL